MADYKRILNFVSSEAPSGKRTQLDTRNSDNGHYDK